MKKEKHDINYLNKINKERKAKSMMESIMMWHTSLKSKPLSRYRIDVRIIFTNLDKLVMSPTFHFFLVKKLSVNNKIKYKVLPKKRELNGTKLK
jgi:hypothetical protein